MSEGAGLVACLPQSLSMQLREEQAGSSCGMFVLTGGDACALSLGCLLPPPPCPSPSSQSPGHAHTFPLGPPTGCSIEEELYSEAPSPEQAERVRALFHRQLAVPLADGAQALEAYKQWEAGLPGRAGQDFKVGWGWSRGGGGGGR